MTQDDYERIPWNWITTCAFIIWVSIGVQTIENTLFWIYTPYTTMPNRDLQSHVNWLKMFLRDNSKSKILRQVIIEQQLITCFKFPDILFQLAPRIVWLLAPFLYQILSRWSTPQTCPLLLTDTWLYMMIFIKRIFNH